MNFSASLRHEINARAAEGAAANNSLHDLTAAELPSVIFGLGDDGRHGNFHPTSYRNICANPQWARRLAKVHTGYRKARARANWAWRELDCASSSDALLMNIFCYRRALTNPMLCSVLGVTRGLEPEFGFHPAIPLRNGKVDRTEIDMRLGDLLVEAKLTESGFQPGPARLIERYRDLEIFDLAALPRTGDLFQNYQLIRGVLAAYSTGGSFCLLCDARRPDLIEQWYSVVRTVSNCDLRCRLLLITWQEITHALSKSLRQLLQVKCGL
jgi:Restriction Endonuclease associating with ARP